MMVASTIDWAERWKHRRLDAGILWLLPLLYAVWTAFHPAAYATHFDLFAP